MVFGLLLLLTGTAPAADADLPQMTPSETRASDDVLPHETQVAPQASTPPATWRTGRRLTAVGLAAGSFSLATNFAGSFSLAFGSPEAAVTLMGASTGLSAASGGLVFAGVELQSDWLRDQGTPVWTTPQWVILPLTGAATGFGALTAARATTGDPEAVGLLPWVHWGFQTNLLGVAIAQSMVNADGLRRLQHPPPAPGPLARPKAWRFAKGLGLAGLIMGWSALPLWGALIPVELFAPPAFAPVAVLSITCMALGGPVASWGILQQRAVLRESGIETWKRGLWPGVILSILGSALYLPEIVGAPFGPFPAAMVLYPLGMGMLTARQVMHDHARGGHRASRRASLQVVPFHADTSRGMAVVGAF